MKNFTKLTSSPIRQFTRAFSRLRKTPEFKLVKFDPKLEGDYLAFRNLLIENIKFSALQFLIPNLRNEVNLSNKTEVREYFKDLNKDIYLRDAYNYVTINHDKGPLGYKKILRDGEFIGNTGWMMRKVEGGLITELERGMHLQEKYCSPDLSTKPNSTVKPRVAAQIMRLNVLDLLENKDSLDMNGKIISNIDAKNIRSQVSMINRGMNVGEPTKRTKTILTWERGIDNMLACAEEVLRNLDKTIDQQR